MTRTELADLLKNQKKAFTISPPDLKKRLDSLEKLSTGVEARKEKLIEAISSDFGLRAREETLMLEIFPLQDQIRHAKRNLRKWTKRRYVGTSWFLLPASSYYQFQPLGSVGIMGAWNYQVLLTLSPLIDAIAAGNHAILKPSEIAPCSAEVIKDLINSTFPKEYIHCVTGDAELASDFSSMSFDHLFFTGSGNVGKKVMAAAAENLTPVSLELGGKSPAIIHYSYPLKRAVKRILAGKLFNAGQTCLAPDYVILPKALNDEFKDEAAHFVQKFYPDIHNNEQYSHIINARYHKKLLSMLEDAENKGAKIVELSSGSSTRDTFMIPPKLIFNVNDDMQIMQEEIFGPLLPVLNLETHEDAVAYVNGKPKPLALYYFDTSNKRINWLLRNTLSGGVTINDTVYHFAQQNLPFGGVGASGMGQYHGYDGFKTFSKKRAVMHQNRLAASDLLHPPFTDLKKRLIRFLMSLSRM